MKTCQQCGNPFSGHFNAKFCGHECRRTVQRAYIKEWKSVHPKPPKPAPQIDPFPSEINREAFGHWLSGFTDGEGCFGLYSLPLHTNSQLMGNRAMFGIQLRSDDGDILRSIQSYWACGNIRSRPRRLQVNPAIEYVACAVVDLISVVVPHFEKFPLRAKKARDFLVWREAVYLLHDIKRRSPDSDLRMQRQCCKWTSAEHEQFLDLQSALRTQRRYTDDQDSQVATSEIRLPT